MQTADPKEVTQAPTEQEHPGVRIVPRCNAQPDRKLAKKRQKVPFDNLTRCKFACLFFEDDPFDPPRHRYIVQKGTTLILTVSENAKEKEYPYTITCGNTCDNDGNCIEDSDDCKRGKGPLVPPMMIIGS